MTQAIPVYRKKTIFWACDEYEYDCDLKPGTTEICHYLE